MLSNKAERDKLQTEVRRLKEELEEVRSFHRNLLEPAIERRARIAEDERDRLRAILEVPPMKAAR